MGYLNVVETDQLPLPSNPDYWVKMKRQAEYGDSLAAQSAMLKMTQPTALPGQQPEVVTEMEAGAYNRTLLARMIVEWNLTDAADRLLAVDANSIERLKPEDGEFLADEVQKRIKRRSKELQGPFSKPSGQGSTGTKLKIAKR